MLIFHQFAEPISHRLPKLIVRFCILLLRLDAVAIIFYVPAFKFISIFKKHHIRCGRVGGYNQCRIINSVRKFVKLITVEDFCRCLSVTVLVTPNFLSGSFRSLLRQVSVLLLHLARALFLISKRGKHLRSFGKLFLLLVRNVPQAINRFLSSEVPSL